MTVKILTSFLFDKQDKYLCARMCARVCCVSSARRLIDDAPCDVDLS